MDYIVWGLIVITGMLLQYILILSHIYFKYLWIWVVLISFGWIFSLYNSRKHHEKMPRTYTGKLLHQFGVRLEIGMTIVGFLGTISHAISPLSISPLLSVMIGAAYFITGKAVESKWFTNLSFGWWIGAIVMFYVTSYHQF